MADVLKAHDPNTMPGNGSPSKAKKGKRMSVERIYQKKTQREHILLRPDSYIGATESTVKSMWVWDEETRSIVMKEITYSPGLYKIFDEVLVNAADNKQRDPSMNMIKINIDVEKNVISIWNNGKGIPIEMHAEQKVYVPTLIFGQLLTSSNYDDTQKKITGGRNGFGAKLCNIYSKKFSIETACGEYGKKFKQVWKDNMTTASEPIIKENKGTDFTCVTFSPDLPRFHMEKLTNDMVALLKRRAYDVAGSSRGVTVLLNGEKLNVKNFKDYVDLYVKNVQKDGERLKVVHEVFNKRWEICVTVSENGFQQASFVNSIATTKGGTHTNYIVDQIVQKMVATVKRKASKELNIKPFQIKNHLWVFVNCLIENPCFDSQTKENMTLNQKSFGSTCELNEKFIKSVQGCGVLDSIMNWVKFKTQEKLNSKCSGQKKTKLKGIAKLDDANDAGGAKSRDCTLILTEGDSAKTLAISGLGIIGRDKYGVFPLRGKLLNVREATSKQIMENAEINNIVKIVGLQYKKKYESDGDLKTLRYGRIMIMTDQDQDGSHIKGLLINFIHHNWPSLLHMKFLEEFITPIVKVAKGGQSLSFYSLPELEEWKQETANAKSWKVKYYKGLGTSTSKEAKEYFTDMKRHRIKFDYDGPSSDQAIELAFSKKMIGGRKDWLTSGMEERKRRRELGMPEIYLYGKDTRTVSYTDFVNKELILFSNADNERSIPSLVDGLKPGQRKVMFTCLKRNDKREVKVAQLAGSIAELSAYHHGETSLMGTIVNLAQNYVGSNNINLLQPIGQFGTRINGGKDSASPRYIFTMLSPLARMIFPEKDDPLLKNNYDDGLKIEPEWYCPILPMVLVNGAEGIGTGWSTKVPNYDPREIVANIKRMIDGEAIQPMFPWYKNFTGTIEQTEPQKYNSIGTFQVIDDAKIEITELPIRTWTSNYKDSVLEPYLHGTEKVKPLITDYRDCSSDKTVDFIISMQENDLAKAEQEGIAKKFKLESSIACTSMVLFDANGVLRKYDSVEEILKDFFEVRRQKYRERKAYLKGMLEAEASKLENQARFILEKIDGDVAIENKSKRDLVTMLVEMNYLSDPVKTWKNTLVKDVIDSDSESGIASEAGSVISGEGGPDFNYILNMNLWSLSRERKEQLLAERDRKKEELAILMKKSPEDLWLEDLDTFSAELDRIEEIEREEDLQIAKNASKGKAMRQQTLKRPAVKKEMKKKAIKTEVQEKKKKENKETEKKEIEEINDEKRSIDLINDNASTTSSGILSLAERLALKKDGATQKKQSRLSFDGVKKKKKLTMPVSDEEDTFDISDDGDDFMLAKKKKAPTLKRTKPTLTFEAEESEGENSEVERTKELIKRLTPVKPKKSAVTLESGSDNLTNGEKSTKEGAAKKGKKAKKDLLDVISDSGSEQEFDKDSEKYSMKEGSEKGSDSEICILEEESSPPAQKKKAPVKKPPAKKAPAKKTKTAAGASKPRAKKADKKDAKDGKQMTLFASAAKATAKRKPTFLPESDDDVDDEKESKPASNKTAPKDEAEPKAKKMKTKATKPAAPKKKRVIESDDDDDDKFSFDEPMQPSPAKPTRAARTNRAKVKYNFDESDGEDKEKSYHVDISDDDDDDDDYDSDF